MTHCDPEKHKYAPNDIKKLKMSKRIREKVCDDVPEDKRKVGDDVQEDKIKVGDDVQEDKGKRI